MALRLNNGPTPTPPSLPDEKHALMVGMLTELRADWSPSRLDQLFHGEGDIDDVAQRVAEFVKDQPSLWVVSDDDFIRAAADVDREVAFLLATPSGLGFLHRMSRAVALRGAILKARSIFG